MSEFFISHAKKDGRLFALELHDALEIDGFQAWFDEKDIEPGANWDDSIDAAIRACVGMIVVMTPGSVASQVCKDEINLAINLGKPIIPLKITPRTNAEAPPLQPLANQEIPGRLQRRQYIDFTTAFDQGMARLRQQLHQIRRVRADIDKLAQEKADLQAIRDNAPTPANVDHRVGELDEQIKSRQRVLTEPEKVREENQRAIDVGIQSELQGRARAEEHARGQNRQRIVGSAPLGVSDIFKDRDKEFADITNWLIGEKAVRAVSIVGRGGAGKTALACKVLHELENDYKNVHGILYLTAETRRRDLTLERIFVGCAKIMGGDDEKRLENAWGNANLTLDAKISILLDYFAAKRCILLFDNLEDILDANGKVMDADLQTFIDAFLRRDHDSCLLITSREPLNPADDARRYERTQPLNEGLPEDYAVELLREFDADGSLGLRDADAKLLKQAAEKTLGFPRALEAIAGILASDPSLSLEALLKDSRLFGTKVIEKLVSTALSRLDDDALKVMQALALFGRPVPEPAVRYLLQPYTEVNGLDVSGVIKRLARGRYITINRGTGDISLHPLDKDYSYKQIPEKPPTNGHAVIIILVLVDLETRAADYYEQLRGDPADWKTIDDLAPILAEFEHRVRAGDFSIALDLISMIGSNYLELWGHARIAVEMRERLQGKLGDELQELTNLAGLARACDALGQYQRALDYKVMVLDYTRRQNLRRIEGNMLGNIGSSYWQLGEYEKAISHHEQALEIAREVMNRERESYNLNQLALSYSNLGQSQRALDLYEQSLKIRREVDDRRGMPATLANIGTIYVALGVFPEALRYFREAVSIDQATNDKPNLSRHIGLIGSMYISIGDHTQAREQLHQALTIAREVGDRSWEANHLRRLADMYIATGDLTAAFQHLNDALPIAQETASPVDLNFVYSGLAQGHLYNDDLIEARKASVSALEYVRPSDRHFAAALQGVILTRLAFSGDQQASNIRQAIESFEDALTNVDMLLADTEDLYSPKYSRGLALVGLALCAEMGAASLQSPQDYVEQAITAYQAARKNCDAAGVLADARRRLDALAVADANGILAPVRAVLA